MEGLSVKSNSFCAVNVKLRSAFQHALNFPPKLAAACKHPGCYNRTTSKGPMLQPRRKLLTKLEKRQASTYLRVRYFRRIRRLMLTLIGAEPIRNPLSRLQLVPSLICLKLWHSFRQIRPPRSKLYRVLNRWETFEPFVRVAGFELKRATTMQQSWQLRFVLGKPRSLRESDYRSAESEQRQPEWSHWLLPLLLPPSNGLPRQARAPLLCSQLHTQCTSSSRYQRHKLCKEHLCLHVSPACALRNIWSPQPWCQRRSSTSQQQGHSKGFVLHIKKALKQNKT